MGNEQHRPLHQCCTLAAAHLPSYGFSRNAVDLSTGGAPSHEHNEPRRELMVG